jgi:hypothetical protein
MARLIHLNYSFSPFKATRCNCCAVTSCATLVTTTKRRELQLIFMDDVSVYLFEQKAKLQILLLLVCCIKLMPFCKPCFYSAQLLSMGLCEYKI